MLIDLDPVDRITTDAVGRPGARVFYLQARKADRLVTLLLEKQQVQLLAASVVEILSRLGKETGEGPVEDAMGLEEPILPEWRAGRLSIGYEEERDLILLEAEELVPDEEEADEEDGEKEDGEEEDGEEEDDEDQGTGILGEFRVGPLWTTETETEEFAGEEEPESEGGWQAAAAPDELEEVVELEGIEELDSPEGPGGELARVRFWATREQMLSLARHGASVCAQGRPRCQLCGNPIEAGGHQCPALNGHRQAAE